MARVRIDLETAFGDFNVSMETYETNLQAWGDDKSYLDELVDEAVRRIKRAYESKKED